MDEIVGIISNISLPLAFSGVLSVIIFFITRQIILRDRVPTLRQTHHRSIINRLFVLSLLAILLGSLGYLISMIWNSQLIPLPQRASLTNFLFIGWSIVLFISFAILILSIYQYSKIIIDNHVPKTIKKILILSANPIDKPRLRLDKEVREIENGLRRAKQRDRFVLHQKWAVRMKDIRQALLDYEPQIVHFCGHGETGGIMVEDQQGKSVLVTPDNLARLFALFTESVECVLLNACYSIPQAVAIGHHIDYVIGTTKEINDETAIDFATGFYDALGAGKSIEESFKFGRSAVDPSICKLLKNGSSFQIGTDTHVQLILEGEVSHFDETTQSRLRNILAQELEIDSRSIKILQVKENI